MHYTSAPDISYIIDPRAPGNAAVALAKELRALAPLVRPKLFAVTSKMFAKNKIPKLLKSTLHDLGLELTWDPKSVSAETVILRNPSFLGLEENLSINIVAHSLIVVANENFLRPSGQQSYDVAHCLDIIDRSSLALTKSIAPVSPSNRSTINNWFQRFPQKVSWGFLKRDWAGVCDFVNDQPRKVPRDRRGRYAPLELKYFPSLSDMKLAFSNRAEANVMLGAEQYVSEVDHRSNWHALPHDGDDNASFFGSFDFLVYFTSPTWQESFCFEIAESIAAGKMVITDPVTASTFGESVISAAPKDVDQIIDGYMSNPGKYAKQVLLAQRELERFSPTRFREFFCDSVGIENKYAA